MVMRRWICVTAAVSLALAGGQLLLPKLSNGSSKPLAIDLDALGHYRDERNHDPPDFLKVQPYLERHFGERFIRLERTAADKYLLVVKYRGRPIIGITYQVDENGIMTEYLAKELKHE